MVALAVLHLEGFKLPSQWEKAVFIAYTDADAELIFNALKQIDDRFKYAVQIIRDRKSVV